jgi:glucosamine 6-phosphate synthetase-like amidotransferase/phosphosugar isomerase protein
LLKNRGYDSAGIVSFSKNGHKVQKLLGKFAEEGDKSTSLNCIERLVEKFTK